VHLKKWIIKHNNRRLLTLVFALIVNQDATHLALNVTQGRTQSSQVILGHLEFILW